MIESSVSPIKRFNISPESIAILKNVKIDFFKLKEKISELNGIAFFGSRTLGREKPESDIDCVLFIESSEISDEKSNRIVKITKIATRELNSYQKSRNSLVPYNALLVLNISKEETDKDINDFRDVVNEQIKGKREFTEGEAGLPPSPAYKLLTRFFLGTGEGLYKNRKYILEKLAQEKDGEILWQKIIEYLSYFERTGKTTKRPGLSPYDNYPKTIAEAQKFFINT